MADIKFNMPIRYLIFFPFFLLLCPIAHAAIGIDSSSTSWYATSTNLTTITVTSSQSNQLLVVSLWDFASIAPTATAVTAGGVTMTQAAAVEEQGSVSGDSWNYIYYLTAPSTGLVNVTTTWSSPPSGAVTQIVSLYNVAQSSPVDASSTSVGQTAHNVSTTVTTVTNNDIIIDSAGTKASSTGWAVGTGQTQLSRTASSTFMGQSYKQMATAGATSTYWVAGNTYWSEVAVAFKQYVAPVSTPVKYSLNGFFQWLGRFMFS